MLYLKDFEHDPEKYVLHRFFQKDEFFGFIEFLAEYDFDAIVEIAFEYEETFIKYDPTRIEEEIENDGPFTGEYTLFTFFKEHKKNKKSKGEIEEAKKKWNHA